jgi:uncharacterized repeat protein (TIGR03803 family)
LYSFNGSDAKYPGTLVEGLDGNFYGIAQNGGTGGVGIVFQITANGTLTTLHDFCSQSGCSDGANPAPTQALIQAIDGNFYGTTQDVGGDNSAHNGTIFKITSAGTLTTPYSYPGGQGQPYAGVIQASDGNFYGTTFLNGIFSLTPGGTLTSLSPNGYEDVAALVQANNGVFYGTAQGDGTNGVGTVFSLSLPDTTPPTVGLSANPNSLWPPNGKMVSVVLSGTIVDNGSGVNASTATFSVADEYGQVQPSGSVAVGSGGAYSFSISLQASRNGNDLDGRQYTVTVSAKDNAGNLGSASTMVTVPHDQGH